ncbi:MAG: YbjQ family protein [Candidatus Wallbacteria bacterium]|nr:YbjQ family protein [Candidatus Wallbacteria bacterium]
MDSRMVTTAFHLEGWKTVKHYGVVRGISVRSRSLLGNIAGGLQTLLGGDISIYRNLCEKARKEAFDVMMQHAEEVGANAIVGMRYDANEVIDGVTEVLCYGTAVGMEKVSAEDTRGEVGAEEVV